MSGNTVVRQGTPGTAPPPPLRRLFPELPGITALDIGASDVEGPPPYASWQNDPSFSLVGFEPSPEEFEKLQAAAAVANSGNRHRKTYLPYALGDGNEAELKICRVAGMTSLLEPDLDLLGHFFGFGEWSQVVKRIPISTRRLDDLVEIERADYLKLDVQGSELLILQNGTRVLSGAVCVHIEVNFVPFYHRQPLFAEIDQFLRGQGFLFHRFTPIISRTFPPFLIDGDIYRGLSQQLWADAIYFRPFVEFDRLPVEALLRTALIAHDLYGSLDLANLALAASDRRTGQSRAEDYQRFLGLRA